MPTVPQRRQPKVAKRRRTQREAYSAAMQVVVRTAASWRRSSASAYTHRNRIKANMRVRTSSIQTAYAVEPATAGEDSAQVAGMAMGRRKSARHEQKNPTGPCMTVRRRLYEFAAVQVIVRGSRTQESMVPQAPRENMVDHGSGREPVLARQRQYKVKAGRTKVCAKVVGSGTQVNAQEQAVAVNESVAVQ